MNSIHNKPKHTYQPLEPFSYPRLIQFFLLLISFRIFICVPYFLYDKLPRHYQVATQLQYAEKLFKEQNYPETIEQFEKITDEFNNFKHGKIRMAQSYFALSKEYDDFGYEDYADHIFLIGLGCLDSYGFNKEEMKDLEKYVSSDRIDEFKSIFTTTR